MIIHDCLADVCLLTDYEVIEKIPPNPPFSKGGREQAYLQRMTKTIQ